MAVIALEDKGWTKHPLTLWKDMFMFNIHSRQFDLSQLPGSLSALYFALSSLKVSVVTVQEMAITLSLAPDETQQSKTNMQKDRPTLRPGDLKRACSHAVMRASRVFSSERG